MQTKTQGLKNQTTRLKKLNYFEGFTCTFKVETENGVKNMVQAEVTLEMLSYCEQRSEIELKSLPRHWKIIVMTSRIKKPYFQARIHITQTFG